MYSFWAVFGSFGDPEIRSTSHSGSDDDVRQRFACRRSVLHKQENHILGIQSGVVEFFQRLMCSRKLVEGGLGGGGTTKTQITSTWPQSRSSTSVPFELQVN